VRDSRSRSFLGAAALGCVFALTVGACSSAGGAGWTYAPEPSIAPAPVASGSAAPSASAGSSASASGTPVVSSAPGQSPNPGGSGATSGGTPGESTIRVVALNIAFDTQQIQAPVGQAFAIEFDNQDQGIAHNIDIKDASGNSAFRGDLVTGPAKTTYQVPSLGAGSYTFQCDVHPTMAGTVVVK
jgi:plastocyanin